MRERPLREILTPERDAVPLEPNTSYATAGIFSYGKGLFGRPVVKGSETSYASYYRLCQGQFVYSKLFAWEGALAVVDEQFDGLFVSQEFPTFSIDMRRAIPSYIALLCSWPETWARVRAGESGMGGRRKRVHPERLLDVILPFPPIPEQRRIVDLIGMVDVAAHRARDVLQVTQSALDLLVTDWQLLNNDVVATLGGLADLGSGPSWQAANERLAPEPGDIRVLGIMNTPSARAMDLGHAKFVGELPPTTRLLTAGSLLMIRTNGNRSRIGNVYRIPPDAYGCAFSAFQIGIHMREAQNADFVYWMLRSPETQKAITENASGTTGLGNIAVRWLKDLEIPWPSSAERTAAVDLLDSVEDVATNADRECQTISSVRTALLDSLLSGERRIPDAYETVASLI